MIQRIGYCDNHPWFSSSKLCSFSSCAANSTHLEPEQTITNYLQTLIDPDVIQGLDRDCVGYLLVVNDKVGIALVIVEDDIDLGVHPVVHTGVIKVTGGVTEVDGRRPPHGGISYSKPVQQRGTGLV